MLRSISCLFVGCLLLSDVAAAQPGFSRLEAWGGLTLVAANLDTTLTTQYTPLIDQYSAPLSGSTAGQTVQVLAGNTTSFGGGVNVFFSRHVGFQFLLDSDGRDLTGTNGDYKFLLNYTAKQPPDYVEKTYSYSRTFTPCDAAQAWGCTLPTTGSLRQTTLGFNLVGRWQAGNLVNVELSGGLSYYNLRGDAQALRYTAFRMGGHSTLWSEEYQTAYSIGPAHGYGVNIGGTFDIELVKHLALAVDARFPIGAGVSAPIVVTEVTNKDTIVFLQEPATIQKNLHPSAIDISPARVRFLVGLKIRR